MENSVNNDLEFSKQIAHNITAIKQLSLRCLSNCSEMERSFYTQQIKDIFLQILQPTLQFQQQNLAELSSSENSKKKESHSSSPSSEHSKKESSVSSSESSSSSIEESSSMQTSQSYSAPQSSSSYYRYSSSYRYGNGYQNRTTPNRYSSYQQRYNNNQT